MAKTELRIFRAREGGSVRGIFNSRSNSIYVVRKTKTLQFYLKNQYKKEKTFKILFQRLYMYIFHGWVSVTEKSSENIPYFLYSISKFIYVYVSWLGISDRDVNNREQRITKNSNVFFSNSDFSLRKKERGVNEIRLVKKLPS